MSAIAAILLAAGESRRMGQTNKLLVEVEGVPLLRRTVRTLLGTRLKTLVVVLGFEADTARALLTGLPVTVVENPAYRDGQMTSVHHGLEALSGGHDGVMVCLADQPLLEVTDINHLIDAFARRTRGAVLVPTFQGQRGNPIILDAAHRSAILNGQRNLGCKRFIAKNPQLVTTVEMDTDHVVFDLDTPGDYAALEARLNMRAAGDPGGNNHQASTALGDAVDRLAPSRPRLARNSV